MPRKPRTPYVMVDENILGDPKIEDLVEEEGMFGFGVYVGLLTLIRRYEDENFMIPFQKISGISKKYFKTSEKRMMSCIDKMLEIGLFEQYQDSNGERYFFSRRRQTDLLEQKELRQKQKASAEETNRKRYGSYSTSSV